MKDLAGLSERCIRSALRRDFHIHTNVSPDAAANCTLESIAAVAAGLGINEIGLTDHLYTRGENAPGFYAKITDGTNHRALCEAIRSCSAPLRILASWEVDWFEDGTYSCAPEEDLARLDYVLLGHHAVRHVQQESADFLARYLLRVTMDMAREPYANIIAHPFYFPPPAERHGRILAAISDASISEIFHAIRENGKAAEITAYQFSADLRDVDQMKRVYARARETGVKFTLDSDTHSLWGIGEGSRCLNVLEELGFTDADFVDYAALMALKDRRTARG